MMTITYKLFLKKLILNQMKYKSKLMLIFRTIMILKIQTAEQKMNKAQNAFYFAAKNLGTPPGAKITQQALEGLTLPYLYLEHG